MARRGQYTLGVDWTAFRVQTKDPLAERRRVTILGYGPEELGLRLNVEPGTGVMAFVRSHPELFATSSTTFPEGMFYWALDQILGPEGPEGGWYYQRKVAGGSRLPGGATVDFVIERVGKRPLAVRIVTPFHLATFIGDTKQAGDIEQLNSLTQNGYDVIDVFSTNFVHDESGVAVKREAESAIASLPSANPLSATYLRVDLG